MTASGESDDAAAFEVLALRILALPGLRRVIAVDGRSASGKSTFAQRLSGRLPRCAIVRTDDVAWYESFFGWDRLLLEHVLEPYRSSRPVDYRPESWRARDRRGSLEVPETIQNLVIEGVGSSRHSLTGCIDVAVWVECDPARAFQRYLQREGDTAETRRFWDEWNREEESFLDSDQPWLRADFVVGNGPDDEWVIRETNRPSAP